MSCEDYTEALNALLDGELAPAEAAPLAAHITGCPACTQTLAELAQLRAALALAVPEEEPSAALQARIEALLEPNILPLPRRRFLPNPPAWLAACALAAALMLALLSRHDPTKDLMSVRDAALRAGVTLAATSPAPAVPGFTLTSNRLDEVAGHLAQVANYARNGNNFALCIWAAHGEPAHGVLHAQYHGMDIEYWNDGKNEYWAAAITPGADLAGFVTALSESDS